MRVRVCVFVGETRNTVLDVQFEISVRHPSEGIESEGDYMCLEFRSEIRDGEKAENQHLNEIKTMSLIKII